MSDFLIKFVVTIGFISVFLATVFVHYSYMIVYFLGFFSAGMLLKDWIHKEVTKRFQQYREEYEDWETRIKHEWER